MKNYLILAIIALGALMCTGCIRYSTNADPSSEMDELMEGLEDLTKELEDCGEDLEEELEGLGEELEDLGEDLEEDLEDWSEEVATADNAPSDTIGYIEFKVCGKKVSRKPISRDDLRKVIGKVKDRLSGKKAELIDDGN